MSPAHRRFLLLEQGVGSIVVNFPLNAAIAWLSVRGLTAMPLLGQPSIAADTVATCVILPLLTTLIATMVVRKQMQAGAVAPLGWTRASHPLLRCLPAGTLMRGLVLGFVCALVLGPATVGLLQGLGIASFTPGRFIIFKASFASFAGVLITPIVALWAIAGPAEPIRRDSAA